MTMPLLPTTLDAMLEAIKRERAALNAVLATIPHDRMQMPDAIGSWSVKDVLAHLAVWLSRDITLLFQAERTRKPVPAHIALKTRDWDAVNANDYAEQKDRPLERIQQDFNGTHVQLIKRLESWRAHDPRMLFDPGYYASMDGISLAAEVWGSSAEHDFEHRLDLEAWRSRDTAP
jgi:hypothetical protein